MIADRTGIDREVLDGQDPLLCSVAHRMSWAAQRQTTRVEDQAYCLMGLFGVNMPLIYGEKHKAFLRLQVEIMKVSEDRSIFAWKAPAITNPGVCCGPLAESPEYFAESRNFAPIMPYNVTDYQQDPPFSMTSRGVNIFIPLIQVNNLQTGFPKASELFFAIIDCQDPTDARGPLGIFLVRDQGCVFRRCLPHRLEPAGEVKSSFGAICPNEVYIAQSESTRRVQALGANIPEKPNRISRLAIREIFTNPDQRDYTVYVPELPEELLSQGAILSVCTDPDSPTWDPEKRQLRFTNSLAAAIYMGNTESQGWMLLIGFDLSTIFRAVFREAIGPLNREKWEQMSFWEQTRLSFHNSFRDWIDSVTLDFGHKTKITRENPKFNQGSIKNVYTKRTVQVKWILKEKVVDGQWCFEVGFERVQA